MNLSALVKLQIDADEKRGFSVAFENDTEKYAQLLKDLIGLYGEVGEFSNLLKKVGLKLDHPNYKGPSFSEADAQLREELADSVIYIIRISAIIGADLEKDILEKMNINKERYRALESS